MESVTDHERDLTYADLVERHWAALYRSVFLLTGDHQRAEDLVQTALMKVYLAWPRVVSMSHPEAYARTVMVNQLTSWRRRSSTESTALTLVESIQPAFDELVVQARGSAPTRCRYAGSRRRRVGAAASATVAAVVAAAILVPVLGERRSDPEPVEPPPPPRLGNVPAWVDLEGDIHVGEHELALPEPPGLSEPTNDDRMPRFSLTERGVVWRDTSADSPLYWQALNGEPVELTAQRPLFFTADPLGDLVVWVTTEHEMVTFDVAEHRVIDSRSVPDILPGGDFGPVGNTLPVLLVDDDRVVYQTGEEVWTLDLAAGTTTRMPGVSASDLLDYGPTVSAVAITDLRDQGGARSLAQLAFRTATGTVQAEPRRNFQEGRLSPDGRWFVTSTGYEAGLRTVVLDTSTGKQVPLDLPDEYRAPTPSRGGGRARMC